MVSDAEPEVFFIIVRFVVFGRAVVLVVRFVPGVDRVVFCAPRFVPGVFFARIFVPTFERELFFTARFGSAVERTVFFFVPRFGPALESVACLPRRFTVVERDNLPSRFFPVTDLLVLPPRFVPRFVGLLGGRFAALVVSINSRLQRKQHVARRCRLRVGPSRSSSLLSALFFVALLKPGSPPSCLDAIYRRNAQTHN